jgi:hypothetical protein
LGLRGDTGAVASTIAPAVTRGICEHGDDAAALRGSLSLGSLAGAAAVHTVAADGGAADLHAPPPTTPESASDADASSGGHASGVVRSITRDGAASSYLQLLSWCSTFLPLVGLALDPGAYAAEVARTRGACYQT